MTNIVSIKESKLVAFVTEAAEQLTRIVKLLDQGKTEFAGSMAHQLAGRTTALVVEINFPDERDMQLSALRRLLELARGDTGQCQYVRNFLLAWWNAGALGGFDFTDLWNVDAAIKADMFTVLRLAADCHCYPDEFGFGQQFERLAVERQKQRGKLVEE